MKIYYRDNGWQGAFVVVAETKQQAYELMLSKDKYKEIFYYEADGMLDHHKTNLNSIHEVEIKDGLFLNFRGDS